MDSKKYGKIKITVGLLAFLIVGSFFIRKQAVIFTSALVYVRSLFKNENVSISSSLANTSVSPSLSIVHPGIVAEKLDTPWAIAFLPDQSFLVTERAGRVLHIDSNKKSDSNLVATIPTVAEIGEGGLLGIAIHPEFSKNHFVYLYYTYREAE